jgi:hypothetical protein
LESNGILKLRKKKVRKKRKGRKVMNKGRKRGSNDEREIERRKTGGGKER